MCDHLDVLWGSVQDLFDAPAAQEEVEALLDRLDEAVGEVPTQEVLASSEAHGHVAQVLPQRGGGGGHGLGERTLRMHGSSQQWSGGFSRAGRGERGRQGEETHEQGEGGRMRRASR